MKGRELDRQIAEALGWVDFWESRDGVWLMGYPPVEQGAGIDAERHPVPAYSTDLEAAWSLVEILRDAWTDATANADGFGTFEIPFDDGAFFDMLHRHADRRWPWAFLYVTPEAIARAFLHVRTGKYWAGAPAR